MADSASSPAPPTSVLSSSKSHFFHRIFHFLCSKLSPPPKRHRSNPESMQSGPESGDLGVPSEPEPEPDCCACGSGEKRIDADSGRRGHGYACDENKVKADESIMVSVQRAVKEIHFGGWEERERAAEEIKKAAAAKGLKMRKRLGKLGVIPPLVAMLYSWLPAEDGRPQLRRCVAIQALVELANGSFTNKATMVEAGILSKLPRNIHALDEATRHDFAQILLSLSFLANTHFPLDPSMLVPSLLSILESRTTSQQTEEVILVALLNLSNVLQNTGPLISNRVVDTLLRLSSSKVTLEKALSVLGNLVVTPMGKKALEDSTMVPQTLIDILTWDDEPKCQELSAYVLMILAHKSSIQREKMAKHRIVHVLVEVALLGTPLVQKRALKLLQWFKDERQTKVGLHSGPQTRSVLAMGSSLSERETSEGKRLIKRMVKESLYKNMEVITRRANALAESRKLKSSVISSSSKSLPY